MKLLFKLLKQNISPLQLLGFIIVNFIGGVIVLSGMQASFDFRKLSGKEDQLLSGGYVVISKPVTSVSTVGSLFGLRPSFSKSEIKELEELSSVSSVGAFVPAEFEIKAALAIGAVKVKSDIFLEAVPDEFIKNDYNAVGGVQRQWSATLESDTVPIIIPRNYFNLYNFGFAASHGLPQISDELLGEFPIKLYIYGSDGIREYDAVVCGLTNRLNTILAPMDFISEANAVCAPGVKSRPSRLILATDASEADESLFGYLNEREYVVEGDSSHVRLQTFIYSLIFVVIAVGLVFSLLAFSLLVISIILLIEKNREKIINLYYIGYSPRQIAGTYMALAVVADVVVWGSALVATLLLYPSFSDIMSNASPTFVPAALSSVVWAALLSAILFALMHCAMILRQVRRHCLCLK